MAKDRRNPRLGRGLSSLVGRPMETTVPAEAAPQTPPQAAPEAPAHPANAESPAGATVEAPPASQTGPTTQAPAPVTALPDPPHTGTPELPIQAIQPNRHQPRQQFDGDALARLAASIHADGLLQPIVVRPVPAGSGTTAAVQYELVAGERRWRAAQVAGMTHIPAIVREMNDHASARLSLIENLQREDLNPIDRAEAFQSLIDDFSLTHDAVAAEVGVERSSVSNALRLLSLAPEVRDMIRAGALSLGQGKALAGVEGAERQVELARRCVSEELSVRKVEALVKEAGVNSGDGSTGNAVNPPARPARSAHLVDLERQLGEQLATKVKIKPGRKKGAGAITIEFFDPDHFESLLNRLDVSLDV